MPQLFVAHCRMVSKENKKLKNIPTSYQWLDCFSRACHRLNIFSILRLSTITWFAFPALANGYTRCYFPALTNGYTHCCFPALAIWLFPRFPAATHCHNGNTLLLFPRFPTVTRCYFPAALAIMTNDQCCMLCWKEF